MHSVEKAPGLKLRRNRDGTLRAYWAARPDLVKLGYHPKTVRLHYDPEDPADALLMADACRRLQSELLAWAAGHKQDYHRFDGTLGSLIRLYQTDEASPYHALKWNTKRTYDHVLSLIERAFGKRVLPAVKIGDFRRWYDEAKKPKLPDGPERVRRAHGIIQMMRRLFAYGVTAEIPECARLIAILDEARFKQPRRRRIKLEYHHVQAFIEEARDRQRLSLALGGRRFAA